jgi:hypothetical protein
MVRGSFFLFWLGLRFRPGVLALLLKYRKLKSAFQAKSERKSVFLLLPDCGLLGTVLEEVLQKLLKGHLQRLLGEGGEDGPLAAGFVPTEDFVELFAVDSCEDDDGEANRVESGAVGRDALADELYDPLFEEIVAPG